MKQIKAIVADIDGTLVSKGEKMMPLTRQALEALHRQGVLVGLASGRPFDRRLLEFSQLWDLDFDFDLVIGMNGDDLWIKDHPQVEHFYPLKKEVISDIFDVLDGLDYNAIVYRDGYDEVEALRMDEFMQYSIQRNHSNVHIVSKEEMARMDTGKLEVHYNLDEHDELMKRLKAHTNPDWQSVITYMGTIEFQDPRVDKGVALEKFARHQGIGLDEILAFGDMDNDIALLEKAGTGICLVNGSQAAKAAADGVTEKSVREDGVGHWLFDHIDQLQQLETDSL